LERICEELNNFPQIPTTVTTDDRPLTSNAANSRSNVAAKTGWRWNSEREFGDQGGEKESLETKAWRMREGRLSGQSERFVCKKKQGRTL